MDFVAQRLPDGRWIRVLTVVDRQAGVRDAAGRQRAERREGGRGAGQGADFSCAPTRLTKPEAIGYFGLR
jgi:hypothetical protein